MAAKGKLVLVQYHTLNVHILQCNDPQRDFIEWYFEWYI